METERTDENFRILSEKLKEAEAANEAKREFLSKMSHDIRTPISGIIGLVNLAQKCESKEEMSDYLRKIQDSAEFLHRLIDDILDMSKIESGKLALCPEPYSFSDLEKYILAVVEPLCNSGKVHLMKEKRGEEYTVLVDRMWFNRIFINIIGNAVKYTPAGGTVKLVWKAWRSENSTIEMDYIVSDNGIGMDEAFLSHVFEPFAQERGRQISNHSSSGLGLAIVKQLVDRMGGTIQIQSCKEEGTIVSVHLSCPEARKEEEEREEFVPYDLTGKHILFCEDNDINAEIIRVLLETNGMTADYACDGKEAVRLFDESNPGSYDAILMDVIMPNMNGLEASEVIRSRERKDASIIPIIALTANAWREDEEKSHKAGMNGYLVKPVDADLLCQMLGRLISEADGHK